MQPINNMNTPDGLDEMLKQAFLDLDLSKAENSRLMDEVARQVMGTEMPVAGNAAKSLQVGTAASVSKAWVWILSGVAGLSVLSIAAFLLFAGAKKNDPVANEQAQNLKAVLTTAPATENRVTDPGAIAGTVVPQKEETSVIAGTNTTNNGIKRANRNYQYTNNTMNTRVLPEMIQQNKEYLGGSDDNTAAGMNTPKVNSPKTGRTDSLAGAAVIDNTKSKERMLSAEELEQHKKDMKTLDDSFAGMKLSDYSKINSEDAKSPIRGNFFLKKTEVTIKEYKLFLTDLLANGKVKEYDIAKPKLDGIWTDKKDKNNRAFLEMYFRKSKYENNPVICISTEAMEMYCNWMKEQLESYYKRNREKVKFVVRMPEITEWKYVASEGNKRHRFGTSNGRLQERGLFHRQKSWTANFIEAQQKFVAVDDSLIVLDEDVKTTGKVTKRGFIGPARAYPATRDDVFNMSGNVSEVVVYKDDKGNRSYRSIGGNWNSTANYLKIDAPDEFKGNTDPSPYIGFRPVIEMEK